MTECSLCGDNITVDVDPSQPTRKIAIKLDSGSYVCIQCSDALMFLDDINTPKRKPKPKVEKLVSKSFYSCHKCNASYTGTICPECQTPNLLLSRKPKKKKRKRKKKK